MFILNQDHDRIYLFDPNALFYTALVTIDGVLYGINLIMGSAMLGTFDSVDMAVAEIEAMFSCKSQIYTIRRFSEWRAELL